MGDKITTTESGVQASNPSDLLRLAVTSGADVDKLEKLMDLQERYDAKQARKAFDASMSKFQSEMPTIVKTRAVKNKAGAKMYTFANSDDITIAIRQNEAACGFSHRFDYKPLEGGGCVTTCIVRHIEGHEETTTVTIPSTKGMNTNSAQDRGIEMQYGTRYSLCGAYGITSANEDTDANVPKQQPATVNTPQAKVIRGLLDALDDGAKLEATMLEAWGIASVEQVKAADFDKLIARLNAKLDSQNEGV